MDLKLLSEDGKEAATVTASDTLFAREHNPALVHSLVTSYLANRRTATRAQKARSDINKSTKKPWRQKGTGRARAGMASSPLWRGGGKIFPSSPDENFSCKVNRKAYRAGMASILSQLVREERIWVIESISVDSPKTRALAAKLKALASGRVLIIAEVVDENLYLSSRNLKGVEVLAVTAANPVSLVQAERVLITRGAVARIEEMWT